MKCLLAAAFVVASLAPASAAESAQNAEKDKAGPVNWLWRHVPKFGGKAKTGVQWNDLALRLDLQPPAPVLPETKRIAVTLQLTNAGKKLVQLEFPTSQRIEVLVKNAAGKVIERWSDDQAFVAEPTAVTINPGERLEYAAAVSTREMTKGGRYTIEAFFPRYEELRVVKAVTVGSGR